MHRVNQDATLGPEVRQAGPIDARIYAHQVRVDASNALGHFSSTWTDPRFHQQQLAGAIRWAAAAR